MKKVLASLLALGVLGGVATGAYLYFQAPAEAAGTQAVETAKADESHSTAKKADKPQTDKDGKPLEPAFVNMTPLVLPLVDSNGVSQIVSMMVTIEVPSKDGVKGVEAVMPRLKDAFIQDMYGTLYKQALTKDGVLKVSVIKDRLNTIALKVLGEESINGILLQNVSQRSI